MYDRKPGAYRFTSKTSLFRHRRPLKSPRCRASIPWLNGGPHKSSCGNDPAATSLGVAQHQYFNTSNQPMNICQNSTYQAATPPPYHDVVWNPLMNPAAASLGMAPCQNFDLPQPMDISYSTPQAASPPAIFYAVGAQPTSTPWTTQIMDDPYYFARSVVKDVLIPSSEKVPEYLVNPAAVAFVVDRFRYGADSLPISPALTLLEGCRARNVSVISAILEGFFPGQFDRPTFKS